MRRCACPAAVLALVAGAGCAPAARWAPARERPRPTAGARAEFAPPRFAEVFAGAVELVRGRGRGLALALCESLAREERELVARIVRAGDAPGEPAERRDPCAPGRCPDGTCVAARAD